MNPKVSFLIVHYNTPRLLRQTLKGILRFAPTISHEIIVVDNNPNTSIKSVVKKEFPQVILVEPKKHLGFGGGMNLALQHAKGEYVFIYNPDLLYQPNCLESLVTFLEANPTVGLVAPRLLHPDKTTQLSCFRFMGPSIIPFRRVPILKNLPVVKKAIATYTMSDWDHRDVMDVDYVLGAAMLMRTDTLKKMGAFDPRFFVYYEDQDLCRRLWKNNLRVVYHAGVSLVHYHRRETAQGSFLSQLLHPLTRIQLKSAFAYYKKYWNEPHPRLKTL